MSLWTRSVQLQGRAKKCQVFLRSRRFLLHVLPERFVRIRYYGLLANRNREKALELCRQVLPGPPVRKAQKMDWRDRLQSLTGIDPMRCEVCGQKALRLLETMAPVRSPRAPPL